jgi:raffinose/stachyose/melibiose transport system substrate-binding protein
MKKKSKYVSSAIAIAFSLTSIVFATQASAATVTITASMGTGVDQVCWAKYVNANFKDSKFKLKITNAQGSDLKDQTAIASGGGPDILYSAGPSVTAKFAKAGQIVDLGKYAKQYGWDKSFAPWSLSLGTYKGKLYSLQAETEAMVMFYNKSVLDTLKVKQPTTIAELQSVVQAASAAGLNPFTGGNKEWKGVNEWFISALFNAVAGPNAVHQALTGKKSWTDPAFLEAVNIINDWQQKGYLSGGLDRFYTATFDEFLTNWASGKAAMNMEGSWRFGTANKYFKDSGNEWSWGPFPTKSGKSIYSIGVGSSWAINKNSKNQDGAAKVLAYLFDKKTQGALATKCGIAPAPIAITAQELKGLDSRQIDFLVKMDAAAKSGDIGYLTWAFWPPKTEQYLINEVEKVWNKTMTPAEYLDGMDKLFKTELQAGDVPPIPARK